VGRAAVSVGVRPPPQRRTKPRRGKAPPRPGTGSGTNGTYETLEHEEDFTVDGSGYAEQSPEHDDAGNLTYDGVFAYGYDAWNRLITVTKAYKTGNGTSALQLGSLMNTTSYDGLGRRIVKAVTNSADLDYTYHYYYNGQQLVETRNGSNLVAKQQVWGLHEETNLIYNRARHLHPTLGRFMQRDPIGYPDGMNGYAAHHVMVGETDFSGLHKDFNPGRSKPRTPPANAKLWDFSNLWLYAAHTGLYEFYNRSRYWEWPDGTSAEWAILGGDFLLDVQGQSEMVSYHDYVQDLLKQEARVMIGRVQVGESETFEDGGSRLITSDLKSSKVRLSLGRFTVWFEAACKFGPKKNAKSGGCEGAYYCAIQWTLYDYYHFEWWEPYGYLGHPFHIYATWSDNAAGKVTSPK